MAEKLTFISYSRREYHFAESLALHLQHEGIDVWFDNQQIEPGENWQADIQSGLQNATALILVASRSSIRSPYVRVEWEHALQTNKPVYVVMFESVKLPRDLHNPMSVIDFRTDFGRGLKALIECLRDGAQRYDSISKLGPWWLLRGFPYGVRRTHFQLLFNLFLWFFMLGYYLSLLGERVANSIDNTVSIRLETFCLSLGALITAFLACRIMTLWSTFIRRKFSLRALEMTLLWMFLFHLLTSIVILLRGSLGTAEWVILLTFVPNAYLWLHYHQHPDFLRWCPLGEVHFSWRVLVNQSLMPASAEKWQPLPVQLDAAGEVSLHFEQPMVVLPTTDDTKKLYQLHYAPGDTKLADEIRQEIGELGYQEITGGEPDYHILVLNPWTPRRLITEVSRLPNLVCLLASTIQRSDELAQLGNLQWIDYRDRSATTLRAAFLLLRDPSAEGRKVSGLNTQPAQLSTYVFPTELKDIYRWLRWIAAWTMAAGLVELLKLTFVGLVSLYVRIGVGAAEVLLTLLNLALVVYGWYLFRLGDQVVSLRKAHINLHLAGLLPVAIVVSETVVLNIGWQLGTFSGINDPMWRLLAILPQVIIFLALGFLFRRALLAVSDHEQLPDHPADVPGIPPFRTPTSQNLLAFAAALATYVVLTAVSFILGYPVIAIIAIVLAAYWYWRLRNTWVELKSNIRKAMPTLNQERTNS